ncbi:hypothetical protein J8J40_28585, partial [Mycobacterium tuberculosis]|nr:hypothetical protein [Mycobacterium tuberculosis]
DVGVFTLPAPAIAADKKPGAPALPFAGGIGYGVNKNSKNLDLAVALVETLAAPGPIQSLVKDAGVVPANPAADTSSLASPSIKQIAAWL